MVEHTDQRPSSDGPLSVTAWLDAEPGAPAATSPDTHLYQDLLREVIDPELGVNIIDLGLVYDIRVADGIAHVRMTMTTPGCPLGAYFDDAVHACLWGAPGVDDIDLAIVWDPPWQPDLMSQAAKDQLGWRR